MEKWVGEPYEAFLELPAFMVIAVLWVVGAVLEVACVGALYEAGSMLVRVLEAVH